jgi:small subunit ribosomal protein S17
VANSAAVKVEDKEMTSDTNAQSGGAEQARRTPHIKTLQGVVVSTKMQKTVVVSVESFVRHPLYKKTLRRTKRYKAHDETNACVLGDVVRLVETRPLSKEKRWRVAEIQTRGNVAEVQPRAIGSELEGRDTE